MIEDNEDDFSDFEDEAQPEGSANIDPPSLSGFHVLAGDGSHLGTYGSREDAEAFVNGHLADHEGVTIVES
jgi:hypothetical protein